MLATRTPSDIDQQLAQIQRIRETTELAQQTMIVLYQHGMCTAAETIQTAYEGVVQAGLHASDWEEFDGLTRQYLFHLEHLLNHAYYQITYVVNQERNFR